jgi:hypothetical protein
MVGLSMFIQTTPTKNKVHTNRRCSMMQHNLPQSSNILQQSSQQLKSLKGNIM